jgi:hypothetical protein
MAATDTLGDMLSRADAAWLAALRSIGSAVEVLDFGHALQRCDAMLASLAAGGGRDGQPGVALIASRTCVAKVATSIGLAM